MAARDLILADLRKNAPAAVEHPPLSGLGNPLPDLLAALAASVVAVGGAFVRAADRAAADAAVRALGVYQEAKRIASLAPGVGASTFDAAALADPHALEGLDLTILQAGLAVAENGAAWIEGSTLPHHALVVIPEHVVVVVEAADVVPDLHAAYARLDLGRRPRWGLFLAGPSKTADIEQSLVIGAHGARSSTLILVG